MQILLMAHSGIRWLVVAVALVTLIVCAIVWLRKQTGKMERTWMSIFTGVLDLQTLLGIIYLVWSGLAGAGFPRYRLEHGVTLLIAVAIAHQSMRWRQAESPIRARNNLFTVLAVFVLIFVGVSRLPQGW